MLVRVGVCAGAAVPTRVVHADWCHTMHRRRRQISPLVTPYEGKARAVDPAPAMPVELKLDQATVDAERVVQAERKLAAVNRIYRFFKRPPATEAPVVEGILPMERHELNPESLEAGTMAFKAAAGTTFVRHRWHRHHTVRALGVVGVVAGFLLW